MKFGQSRNCYDPNRLPETRHPRSTSPIIASYRRQSNRARRPFRGGAFVAAEVLGYHSAITANFNGSEKLMSHARISIDPAVMMGKPCIKGTRITVELILRKLGAGRSFADLLEAYPKLTEDDLRAALAFAADYMQHETVLAAE
jgi:uncharacterized protein (DUF433 family)